MSTSPLARIWRRKLEESGFRDIELPDGSLKPPERPFGDSRRDFTRCHEVERNAIFEYYHRAEVFMVSRAFLRLPKVVRGVWRLHARGVSNSEAAKRLGVTPTVVRSAVTRVRVAAGLPKVTSTIGHGR